MTSVQVSVNTGPAAPAFPVGWSNNMLAYPAFCGKCIFAILCPTCATASARTTYDGSNWLFNCCCLSTCAVRNVIREGYGIPGDCIQDMLWTCCCTPCVIGQMWEEASRRGGLPRGPAGGWTHNLCNCCVYPMTLCYACLCTPCAAAQERSSYDSSNCCFNLFCVGAFAAYNIVREGYNIPGTCISDCLIMTCVPWCGVVQMHGEIQARGRSSRQVGANVTVNVNVGAPQPKAMF